VIWLAADHTLIAGLPPLSPAMTGLLPSLQLLPMAGLPPLLRPVPELAYRRCLRLMYEPITFQVNHSHRR
jgi:hypothetical protein